MRSTKEEEEEAVEHRAAIIIKTQPAPQYVYATLESPVYNAKTPEIRRGSLAFSRPSCWRDKTRSFRHGNTLAPRLLLRFPFIFLYVPFGATIWFICVYKRNTWKKNELRGYCCWAFPEFPRILFDLIIGAANRQGAHSVYLEREFKMAVDGLGRRRRRW